jgi:hypothetical protein
MTNDVDDSQAKELNRYAFPGRQMALIGNTEMEVPTQGLTKREYFAAMAMQGMTHRPSGDPVQITRDIELALMYADELLKQFES